MEKQQVSHTLFGSPVALDCSTEILSPEIKYSNQNLRGSWRTNQSNFVLLTDSLIMLLQNHWNLDLGSLIIGTFDNRDPAHLIC